MRFNLHKLGFVKLIAINLPIFLIRIKERLKYRKQKLTRICLRHYNPFLRAKCSNKVPQRVITIEQGLSHEYQFIRIYGQVAGRISC